MPIKIMQCNCKHEFQDETYGKGMRLHNVSQKKGDKLLERNVLFVVL